jgi:DNA polymerase elongation subunit (family B)
MPVNFARMKKEEIIWMANHRCVAHGVQYTSHPNCYLIENPEKQRTGFIDIEASQLTADWGITLCVSILPLDEPKGFVRTITKAELFSDDCDKALLKDVVKEMRTYDRLIGYYASNMRFDIPFLRTRAIHHDLDFPGFGEIVMEDLFPIVKYKFKLRSNRLDSACEALLGHTTKTRWLWKHWLRAIQGKQESLDYIEDHCIKDTEEAKRLYQKIFKFTRKGNTSL